MSLWFSVTVEIHILFKGLWTADSSISTDWSAVCGLTSRLFFMRLNLFTVLRTNFSWLFAASLSYSPIDSRLPTRRWQCVRLRVTFILLNEIIELIFLLKSINYLAQQRQPNINRRKLVDLSNFFLWRMSWKLTFGKSPALGKISFNLFGCVRSGR